MTCVFLFSLQLLSELFLIQRRTERDMLKHVYLSSRKIPIIPAIFKMKLEFSERIFEKYSNIEFHKKKVSCGGRVVPYGRTDMKLIVVIRNFVNVPKKEKNIKKRM